MIPKVKINNLQLLWITMFGIAMAFFESSIVVYLRALYYPEGFSFPLETIEPHIAVTEFFRELASLIMIASVAMIATKNFMQRFANFLYIFAVWDIFYYVFLWLILGWPESLLTWDVLFLIPVPWTGPVISPILISLLLILFAVTIRYFNRRSDYRLFLEINEWLILLAGAFVVFVSFIWDYLTYLFERYTSKAESLSALLAELDKISSSYIPDEFNWLVFMLGVLLLLTSLSMIYMRYRKHA